MWKKHKSGPVGSRPQEKLRQQDPCTVPVDVAEHLDELKVTQLRDLCRGRDISMSGTKKELIDRLRRYAEGKVPTKTEILKTEQKCNQINRTIRMEVDLKFYDAMQPYAEEGLFSCPPCGRRKHLGVFFFLIFGSYRARMQRRGHTGRAHYKPARRTYVRP
jgi:hypothetical protein